MTSTSATLTPWGRVIGGLRRELGVLASLAIVALGFHLSATGMQFLSASTWGNILSLAAEVGVVALGVTLLMIAGEFDLSVGSVFAFTGMLFALLTVKLGWSSGPAFLASLAAALGIGLLNGAVTLATGIPSFITTLGGLMVWRGLVLAVSEGWPLSSVEEPSRLMRALTGPLGDDFSRSALWWIGLGALLHAVLVATPFGNWLQAVGGNTQAARGAGVPVKRVKLAAFALASLLAGFAGILQFSRLGSFSPTYGEGLELEAIVAAVIGGTALTGGSGGIVGTLLGTVLVGMIATGLVLAGAPVYWFRTFVGIILVLAVILNRWVAGRERA